MKNYKVMHEKKLAYSRKFWEIGINYNQNPTWAAVGNCGEEKLMEGTFSKTRVDGQLLQPGGENGKWRKNKHQTKSRSKWNNLCLV